MSYTIIGRTVPTCDFCVKAKKLLKDNNIQFDFIDLTGRHTAQGVFAALGHTTVPVIIDKDTGAICGYTELAAKLEKVNTEALGAI